MANEEGKVKPIEKQDVESLKNVLAGLAGESRQLPFIISADGHTPHQAVVSAMDVANQLGFHHITFAINPPEKQ